MNTGDHEGRLKFIWSSYRSYLTKSRNYGERYSYMYLYIVQCTLHDWIKKMCWVMNWISWSDCIGMADCILTPFWQAVDRDAEPRIILAATSALNYHWSGPVSWPCSFASIRRSVKFNSPYSDFSYWSEGSCSLTIQSHWLEGAECPIGRQGSVVPQSDLFPVGILVHRVLQ